MHGGLWGRLWARDRPAVAVCAVASLIATVLWRGVTRPMADTVSYRQAADLLLHGWPSLPDRTPGYPLLLLATGSHHGSSHLLFAVQLAMHLVTVALVVDVARRHGVGRTGRTVLAALLVTPPVLLRVVYEGTEGFSAFLLTVVFWLAVTPGRPDRRLARALAAGGLIGFAALVRPTFALLFVPVAVVAALPERVARPRTAHRTRRSRIAVAPALAVALPALAVVMALSAYNGVRFDSYGMTPLMPYHLSSRTSPYVEDLPRSYEPARSVLIRERDAALLRGESSAPGNFIWRARPALARATGLQGPALDRYVLRMDLELILHNPFGYVDTVKTASVNYANMDSQPAILGLGRGPAQVQEALHLLLLAAFLGLLALVPGLALVGQVPRRTARVLLVGLALCLYTGAVSVMVETGTARLRSPSEPILALLLVLSASLAHPHLARLRHPKG
ncbi:hypothetical protein KSP35_07815 [Aquihabitans sp. G128]|uniref:hypothetical protein n=1 Tax=Aquihabitans sp. G128 TaxID=2849779 RepID=UPI001C21DC88|nr:hypothetical protein [Aquihabitans sp. G128]QXC62688.1 hypothetical protein KSP35_07815 [Aquihabitans sp. G128]